jgi:hypothetical protein
VVEKVETIATANSPEWLLEPASGRPHGSKGVNDYGNQIMLLDTDNGSVTCCHHHSCHQQPHQPTGHQQALQQWDKLRSARGIPLVAVALPEGISLMWSVALNAAAACCFLHWLH